MRRARRPAGQREPPHQHGRGEHHPGAGDQAPLADQARQRQVGVPFGQVLGAQEAERVVRPPEQPAGAHRDVRLAHGPARAGRRLVGADQEAAEAGHLVGPQEADQQRRGDRRRGGQRQQEPRGHAPEDQHGRGEDGQQHGGAEVRLQQGEPDGHDREQQGEGEALPRRPAGAEDGGEHEQQPELGELGGLEGERADRDPAGGAVRRQADREDADEQDDGRPVGGPGQDAEEPDAHAPEHRQGQHAAGGDQALPRREVRGADRYRFAIPSPTSATAATTASRSNAALRRFRRCSRVRRRPARAAARCRRRSGRSACPPPPAVSAALSGGRQEPTTTGAEAATAGASVTATTATPSTGRERDDADGRGPVGLRRHGDGPARRGDRRPRAPVDDLVGPGHDLRLGRGDEPHQEPHACTARPARTARAGAGRPRPRSRPRRAPAPRCAGRRAPARSDGSSPPRPASRSRSMSAVMSSRRRTTSDTTTAARTRIDSSQAPMRRPADRGLRERAAPASARAAGTAPAGPRDAARRAPGPADRAHQRGELGADRRAVDRGSRLLQPPGDDDDAGGRQVLHRPVELGQALVGGRTSRDREPGGRDDVREDRVHRAHGPAGRRRAPTGPPVAV